jgi:putative transcriptional regulator
MNNIKCHLSRILGERRITQLELARISGLSTYTINKYYHENWKGIDEATLVKFCRALKMQVGELFEYVDSRDDTRHRASPNG